MRRFPTTRMAGNLRWTRSGVVWADWILTGLPYGLRGRQDKLDVKSLHTGLLRALPGESLLLGLSAGTDPAAIVERMLDGIDPDQAPDWVAECEATLNTLAHIAPGERVYWLSVPLAQGRPLDIARQSAVAAVGEIADRFALPRQGVSREELERRLAQAERIRARIPGPFRPVPASPAQMAWLDLHAQQRGLQMDANIPAAPVAASAGPTGTAPAGSQSVVFSEPLLDEGGQADLAGDGPSWRSWTAGLNPLGRRFLKVTRPDDPADPSASYQSLLVMAGTPAGGHEFPGSEVLGRIDEFGLDVDWAMRLEVKSRSSVALANERALKSLNEQCEQREGEQTHAVGVLDKVRDALTEYTALLAADEHEVECRATVVFCVASPTADGATWQAQALAGCFADMGYRLAQPLGMQTRLWWTMQPGVPASATFRECVQITTSEQLAGLVPLTSNRVGDRAGVLLALNISNGPLLSELEPCGPTAVILHDFEGASESGKDESASFAVSAELGAGKSYLLKSVGGWTCDRGGQVVLTDRTASGEYAKWATSVADCAVASISAEPGWSLDPLRLFGPIHGARVAQSFFTPLLNVAATSPEGALLSSCLEPAYLAEKDITSVGALMKHLACRPEQGARDLARLMGVYASKDFGRVIFDESVPALSLDAQGIVIRTHQVRLPTKDELSTEHLFKMLPLEKVYGRAVFALTSELARTVCFSDPSQFALFINDETHATTSSPEGQAAIEEFIRDCRKHKAAIGLGSHDAADFGSEVMRELIPTRILMRHRSVPLAKRGLNWIGADQDDQSLVDLVTKDMSPVKRKSDDDRFVEEHRRGECLFRDSSGNIVRAKIMGPQLDARATASKTSAQAQGKLAKAQSKAQSKGQPGAGAAAGLTSALVGGLSGGLTKKAAADDGSAA